MQQQPVLTDASVDAVPMRIPVPILVLEVPGGMAAAAAVQQVLRRRTVMDGFKMHADH